MTGARSTVVTIAFAEDALQPKGTETSLGEHTENAAFLLLKGPAEHDYDDMLLKTNSLLHDDVHQRGLAGALWPTHLPGKLVIYRCTETTRYQHHLSDRHEEVVDHTLHEGSFQLVSPKVQLLNRMST